LLFSLAATTTQRTRAFWRSLDLPCESVYHPAESA
jgi:hypothetical protein